MYLGPLCVCVCVCVRVCVCVCVCARARVYTYTIYKHFVKCQQSLFRLGPLFYLVGCEMSMSYLQSLCRFLRVIYSRCADFYELSTVAVPISMSYLQSLCRFL